MEVQFENKKYTWNDMSLWIFLYNGHIPSSWVKFFLNNQDIIYTISEKLEEMKQNNKLIIYPQINHVFRAFIPVNKITVVIVGQDPYHSGTNEYDGSAVGYCFSVSPGNKINPSLRNIYKELKQEKYDINENGDLSHWVKQGCFMINTSLTVEKGCPDSHTEYWYNFTEKVIKYVGEECNNVVWLLMGSKAHKFANIIQQPGEMKHKVLCTSHPSPFSANRNNGNIPAFLGSNVFFEINKTLNKYGKNKIKW